MKGSGGQLTCIIPPCSDSPGYERPDIQSNGRTVVEPPTPFAHSQVGGGNRYYAPSNMRWEMEGDAELLVMVESVRDVPSSVWCRFVFLQR